MLIVRIGLGSWRRSTWTGAIRIGCVPSGILGLPVPEPRRRSGPCGRQGPLCVRPALEERRERAAVGSQERPRSRPGLRGRAENDCGAVAALRGEEAELHAVEGEGLAILAVVPEALTEASDPSLAGLEERPEPPCFGVIGDRRLVHGLEGGLAGRTPVHPGAGAAGGRGSRRKGGRIFRAGQGVGDDGRRRLCPGERLDGVRSGEGRPGDTAGAQVPTPNLTQIGAPPPKGPESRRDGRRTAAPPTGSDRRRPNSPPTSHDSARGSRTRHGVPRCVMHALSSATRSTQPTATQGDPSDATLRPSPTARSAGDRTATPNPTRQSDTIADRLLPRVTGADVQDRCPPPKGPEGRRDGRRTADLPTESDRRRLRRSPTSHGNARRSRRRRPLTDDRVARPRSSASIRQPVVTAPLPQPRPTDTATRPQADSSRG